MATIKISNAAAIVALNAITARLNGGALLRLYSGTVPVDADAALGGATLLAELTLNATGFGAATDSNPGAQAVANAITGDTAANAGSATAATFARVYQSDGATCEIQGTVTAAGGGGFVELLTNSITLGRARHRHLNDPPSPRVTDVHLHLGQSNRRERPDWGDDRGQRLDNE